MEKKECYFRLIHKDPNKWKEFKYLCGNVIGQSMNDHLLQHIKFVILSKGDFKKIAEKYNQLAEINS